MPNDTNESAHLAQAELALITRRQTWPRRVMMLLIVAALLSGGIWLYSKRTGDTQQRTAQEHAYTDRAQPVTLAPVSSQDVEVYLNGLGQVTPFNTVIVKSRVDGEIIKLLFQEGQMVKAGDLLAEIDARPYRVQLMQAEGQLAKDMALQSNAKADLVRYQTLFQQDSIARQQVDTQASLVRQYQGTIKADQSQIDNAKLQLTYTRVTAPIAGRLGLRQVDAGNVVHASDSNGLVVITQLQPSTVVFTIPEDSVPALMAKLRAKEILRADAFDRAGKTQLATGKVMTVDNQIDTATGTLKVKAQFPNDDLSLFPNQFVNIRALLDVRRGATVLPSTAVQRGARGTFIYLAEADNTVTVRAVKLGPSQGDKVISEEGVAVGDNVVVDGTDKLREGAKIAISGAAAANGDGSPAGEGGRRHKSSGTDGTAGAARAPRE